MPSRSVREWVFVPLLAGFVCCLGGCGGEETGAQVQVDKKKADALLNSMGGYSGYDKKKGKGKAAPKADPASTPEPAAKP